MCWPWHIHINWLEGLSHWLGFLWLTALMRRDASAMPGASHVCRHGSFQWSFDCLQHLCVITATTCFNHLRHSCNINVHRGRFWIQPTYYWFGKGFHWVFVWCTYPSCEKVRSCIGSQQWTSWRPWSEDLWEPWQQTPVQLEGLWRSYALLVYWVDWINWVYYGFLDGLLLSCLFWHNANFDTWGNSGHY